MVKVLALAERIGSKEGHVWVYRSDHSADGVAPGTLVGVVDEREKFLGTALYSSASQIAIRTISREAVEDLASLLRKRIQDGDRLSRTSRARHRRLPRRLQRSRFSPGLIVDRYNDLLSLQVLTQAMDVEAVRQVISFRTDRAAQTGRNRRTRRSPSPRIGAAACPLLQPAARRKEEHGVLHEWGSLPP